VRIRTRLLGAAAATAFLWAAQLATPAPAAAHPFGPPATAQVDVDGTEVAIIWQAAEDDWVALGQSLGAFEDPTNGPVDTTLTGEQKLARSTEVRDYLTERIAVRQDGEPCPSTVLPLEDLLRRGARLTFECPRPVTGLEIRLDALTDLHTAYRTVLTSGGPMTPDQVLFTSAQTTHQVTMSGDDAVAGLGLVAVGAGVAAAGGTAVLIAWRLLRRRRTR
jgi:hypothetical protein